MDIRVEILTNVLSTDSFRPSEEADTKRWEAEWIAVLVRSMILARIKDVGDSNCWTPRNSSKAKGERRKVLTLPNLLCILLCHAPKRLRRDE